MATYFPPARRLKQSERDELHQRRGPVCLPLITASQIRCLTSRLICRKSIIYHQLLSHCKYYACHFTSLNKQTHTHCREKTERQTALRVHGNGSSGEMEVNIDSASVWADTLLWGHRYQLKNPSAYLSAPSTDRLCRCDIYFPICLINDVYLCI